MGIQNCIIALGLIASAPSLADELYRLNVDLDSDGKPEVVEVLTGPAPVDWRSTVTIKIGSSTYSADYFSIEGDLPSIKLMGMDRGPGRRYLFLETPEAAWCVFHILSFTDQKPVPLLRFESGPECKAPQPLDKEIIATYEWQGFWYKEIRYRLNAAGTELALEAQKTYSVSVGGAVAKAFTLKGSECPEQEVPAGGYVRLESYDPSRKAYRLETINGGCGWVSEDDLRATITELPIGN